ATLAVTCCELRSLDLFFQHFTLERHVPIMPTRSSMTTIHELEWLRTLATRLACEDQDDLVQETVLAAWKNPPRVDPDRPLRPWLATVARNRARLDARARRRRDQRERDAVDVISPSAAAGPDDELQRVMVLQALSAVLDELSELDRRII